MKMMLMAFCFVLAAPASAQNLFPFDRYSSGSSPNDGWADYKRRGELNYQRRQIEELQRQQDEIRREAERARQELEYQDSVRRNEMRANGCYTC